MPKLLVKSGARKGYVCRFTEATRVTIGRDPSNTLALPDRRVSRTHACVFLDKEGFIIEDLNSVNGTQVNDHVISRQVLHLGDQILLGSTLLQYLSLDASGELSFSSDRSDARLTTEEHLEQPSNVEARIAPDQIPSFEHILSKSDPETLKAAYQKLLILYRISNDLGTVVDLKQLLARINELVLEVTKADRSVIMWKDQETSALDLRVVHSRKDVSINTPISQTIAKRVMEAGESILTTDAMQDERFKQSQSIVFQGIHSTMCVPIKYKASIFGIILVDTKGTTVTFTKSDLEPLTAISNQAAIAIENARLFDDLKIAHDDLKEKQAQLIEAEKLTALGKLAGGVAHEINNPLTNILGYADLCATALAKEGMTPSELKECAAHLRIVQEESQRCEQIVQDLLHFGRRHTNIMAPVNVNHVIERVLQISRFQLDRAPIEIQKDLMDPLPNTIADANQLQQVFLNLIINARDAMDEGGRLTIKTGVADGRWIQITVADSGCGVPPEKLEEIFKPLYTTKEEGKGTGLGLTISQDIIERHKGSIEVESTLGQGTTFTIKLPLAAAAGTQPT